MTIRLVTNTLLLFAFASGLPAAARPQEGPPRPKLDSRIVAAKTAFLTTEILYPKTEKSSFTSELNTILAIASGTKVWTVYKPATATKAETIMKIVEDRRLGTSWSLTLFVYDPEDNGELYKETREYVEVTNDVHRLMNHLLNAVLAQRKLNRDEAQQEAERIREEEKAERERAGKDFEQGVGPAQITCEAVNAYANRGAERRVRRILTKGERVMIITPANNEAVIKIGDIVGYVDARCVQVLPVGAKD